MIFIHILSKIIFMNSEKHIGFNFTLLYSFEYDKKLYNIENFYIYKKIKAEEKNITNKIKIEESDIYYIMEYNINDNTINISKNNEQFIIYQSDSLLNTNNKTEIFVEGESISYMLYYLLKTDMNYDKIELFYFIVNELYLDILREINVNFDDYKIITIIEDEHNRRYELIKSIAETIYKYRRTLPKLEAVYLKIDLSKYIADLEEILINKLILDKNKIIFKHSSGLYHIRFDLGNLFKYLILRYHIKDI